MANSYRVVLPPSNASRPAGPVEFDAPKDTVGDWMLWNAETGKSYPAQMTPDGASLVAILPDIAASTEHEFAFRPMTSSDAYKPVAVQDDQGGLISVTVPGEDPFAVFNYEDKWKKPFIYPLLGPGRARLTRGYPMAPQEGDAKDHEHHKSLWTAYGDVNGVDVWSEGSNSGRQVVEAIEIAESGLVFGVIRARIAWQDKEGQRLLTEIREYRFYNTSDKARILDVKVKLMATDGVVRFGDTKEAGLVAVRVQPQIDEKGGGKLTNSIGQSGMKNLWGKPAAWIDYSGSVDGRAMGLAIFDHPGNLNHPARWHARDYGLLGANNLSANAFDDKQPKPEVTIQKGGELTFSYRVLLHDGAAADVPIQGYYDAYVKRPVMDVVED